MKTYFRFSLDFIDFCPESLPVFGARDLFVISRSSVRIRRVATDNTIKIKHLAAEETKAQT